MADRVGRGREASSSEHDPPSGARRVTETNQRAKPAFERTSGEQAVQSELNGENRDAFVSEMS
jgi:hypothetical protein